MTCEQALELISAKIDHELTKEELERLQAHLALCPDCRAAAEAAEGLDRAVAGLAEPAPEGLKQGVMYRIGQETGKYKPARRRWFGPGTGFGLAAAVLVLLVGTGVIPLKTDHLKAQEAQSPDGTRAAEYYVSDQALPASPEQMLGDPAQAAGSNGQGVIGGMKNPDLISPVYNGESGEKTEGTVDNYYRSGGESDGVRADPVPMDEELRAAGMALSRSRNAAVLLYTEFDRISLLDLLEEEEPGLFEKLMFSEPEHLENGYLACRTDYRTVLAIHEWLLANLPQSESMPAALRQAETELMIRMESLDPGSGSLYSIITWAPRRRPVSWPGQWPEDWASRLRTEENWALFFPAEDYSPAQNAEAWLVFPPEER